MLVSELALVMMLVLVLVLNKNRKIAELAVTAMTLTGLKPYRCEYKRQGASLKLKNNLNKSISDTTKM